MKPRLRLAHRRRGRLGIRLTWTTGSPASARSSRAPPACLESTKVATGRGDGATGHDLCETGTGAGASAGDPAAATPHGVQMKGRTLRARRGARELVGSGSSRVRPATRAPAIRSRCSRYDQTWRFLQCDRRRAGRLALFRAGLEAQIVMAAMERSAATGRDSSRSRRYLRARRCTPSPRSSRHASTDERLCRRGVRRVPIVGTCTRATDPRFRQPDRAGRRLVSSAVDLHAGAAGRTGGGDRRCFTAELPVGRNAVGRLDSTRRGGPCPRTVSSSRRKRREGTGTAGGPSGGRRGGDEAEQPGPAR